MGVRVAGVVINNDLVSQAFMRILVYVPTAWGIAVNVLRNLVVVSANGGA